MTVVGTTIINDSDENSPGRGGVVARQWVERFSTEVTPDPYVIRLVPGADRARVQAQLERHVPGSVNGALLQGAIRNVVRIRQIPLLLTGLVIVLAVTSLAHAMVQLVRRQRSQLAVLKTLGFSRRQVATAVAAQATLIVSVGTLIGGPLGLLAGRWGWRYVADQLGVASPP